MTSPHEPATRQATRDHKPAQLLIRFLWVLVPPSDCRPVPFFFYFYKRNFLQTFLHDGWNSDTFSMKTTCSLSLTVAYFSTKCASRTCRPTKLSSWSSRRGRRDDTFISFLFVGMFLIQVINKEAFSIIIIPNYDPAKQTKCLLSLLLPQA